MEKDWQKNQLTLLFKIQTAINEYKVPVLSIMCKMIGVFHHKKGHILVIDFFPYFNMDIKTNAFSVLKLI